MRVALVWMFAIGIALGTGLSAQGQLDPHQNLFQARSLKCDFPWSAQADWDVDAPILKSKNQQQFDFHVDGIDYAKGTARLIGNAGAEDLLALRGDDSVAFIERTPSGTVQLTTVYVWANREGSFKAVHSRHTAIGLLTPTTSVGGPAPSQNYGFCKVWQ